MNNTNNNCRFCLRIFEELEERIGITSQISDEFRNITQTEVKIKQKYLSAMIKLPCTGTLQFKQKATG